MYQLKPTIRIKVLIIALSLFLFSIQCMARKKKQDRYEIEYWTYNVIYLKDSKLFDIIDSLLTECKKRCPDCYWHYDCFDISWFYPVSLGPEDEKYAPEYSKHNGMYYAVGGIKVTESDIMNMMRGDPVSRPIWLYIQLCAIPTIKWLLFYKNRKYMMSEFNDNPEFAKKNFKYIKKRLPFKFSLNFGPPKIPSLDIFYNTDGSIEVIQNDCIKNIYSGVL